MTPNNWKLTRYEQRAVRACDRLAATYPDPENDSEAEYVDQHVAEIVGERFGFHPEKMLYLWTCAAPNCEMQYEWESDRRFVRSMINPTGNCHD